MAVRIKCNLFRFQNSPLKSLLQTSVSFHSSDNNLYCARENPERKAKKYTDTVNLPQTNFPLRLDSQKRIDRDNFINKECKFESLYEWQRENVRGPEFILHDGPPYANGKPHMGHAINKILKDIILRQKLLEGRRTHYVPGWDCHGLPIELRALGGETNLSPVEIRKKAEQFARVAIVEQKETFKSWGVMANWEKGYFTFDKSYVKNQLQEFYKLYEKGLVYRDIKPVFWSPSSRTALAEAELEYNAAHRSKAVTVRLKLDKVPDTVSPGDAPVYALVWTTTPWTLPVNQAVCFNPELTYSLVSVGGDLYIVAAELVESLQQKLGREIQTVNSFPGRSLEGASYIHPLKSDRSLPLLPAAHVSTSKGTGLVHTAPAHGPDDFLVALRHSIPIECLVDEDGCYMEGAGPALKGLPVLSQGNEAVLSLMAENIVHTEDLVHSYPYDWRTKQPVILRASRQWFIDTNAIKQRAMELLKGVGVFPEHSRSGSGLMTQLEQRPYWCISRQRVWGVPIPVLYHKETGEPLITRSSVDHLCGLVEEHGTDFWWTLPLEELVTKDLLEEHRVSHNEIQRGQDILDIWFDSGMSWSYTLGYDKVADLYLEGLDQFTGWFQSSLMTSVALRDKAPYRAIFVHGFAVDGEGRKMSKSVGNVVDPVDITHGGTDQTQPVYGIDTLRWWVACHATQHTNIPVSQSVIKSSAEAVHKIRIVLRFLLGALHDYTPSDGNNSLCLLDRYLLHLLFEFHQQVQKAYDSYQFNKVCTLLTNFVTNDVSALYCHSTKVRLYCEPADAPERRACQFVISHILDILTRTIAPILPQLAEEIYLYHPHKAGELVFRSGVVKPQDDWDQPEVARVVNLALDVRRAVTRSTSLTNTQQLNATVFTSGETYCLLKLMQPEEQSSWSELAEILQVSSVKLVEHKVPLKYHVELAQTTETHLCGRCRRYTSQEVDEPCSHCRQVIAQIGTK